VATGGWNFAPLRRPNGTPVQGAREARLPGPPPPLASHAATRIPTHPPPENTTMQTSLDATRAFPRALGVNLSRAAAFVALAAFAALGATGAGAQLVEGKNYARLANPQPVETGKSIEVIEFFSFGCPHCADLEPILDGWIAGKPADVELRRIPVAFQPAWERLGKVWYTLHALGKDDLAPKVFNAIHRNGVNLSEPKTFFDWAARNGIDRKKVEDMYNSFTISSEMSRARRLAQVFDIQSVPTIIVDGKFITASDKIGGHQNVPAAINELVAKARAERKG
jgi:thiol:disulfide interchange protein DsbA